ncbi:tyrosine-type recombinase/integrase [Mesorhizobium cantuariense]|uniref:Tyrosine-type recombinase/integrase n=1 Tax=Mesorhizobium cantuariense TaxID=1300275 RepID=A0ABV7MNQ2_9HYPH
MPRKNLTDAFVRSASVKVRTDFWDDKIRGLVLRVTPAGIKTWTVVYTRESDSTKQRVTLGRYPAIDLERARGKALKTMSAVAEGEDPSETKRAAKASMTVEDLGGLFIEKYAKRQKKTWPEDERLLKREIYPKIGRMKALAVKRRDILDIIEAKADAGHGAASTNILAVVRKMFAWAVDTDRLPSSPVTGVKPRSKPVRRDRVLSDAEIRSIWNALPDATVSPAMRDIIRLLFLTGQRSGEVAGGMRSEVDVGVATWALPAARTKNGQAHTVPLSPPALAIMEAAVGRTDAGEPDAALFSKTGAPIASNAVAQAARLKLQKSNRAWTPHDIRRTVATGMAGLGVPPHIIEAVLNHISGFRGGVAGVYNRHSYEVEKRDALEKWADHLIQLCFGKKTSER